MSDNDSDYGQHDDRDDTADPSGQELAVWLGEFISNGPEMEHMYRNHLCTMIVNRLYGDFGVEGMCELMMTIDNRSSWISDIVIDNSDLDELMFDGYGVYDDNIVQKARDTVAAGELNKKIWRLRRKYAKLIVEEIMTGVTPNG